MKKELRIFLIIMFGWLALLNFAILKTVITKYINTYKSIIVKNLVSGAAVYYPLNSNSLFSVLIVPLFIFNALVIVFLSLSYYFWMKSRSHIPVRQINKKGQSAMEFLMTYGWAIMAFIVSISALAYFGVLNFSPTGQAVCALSPGFDCKDFIVGQGGVALVIENSLGVKVLQTTVNITNSPQGPCNESMPPKDLDNGKGDTFFVPCQNINTIGTKFRGDIIIKYRKEGSTLFSQTSGLVTGAVQDYKYDDKDAPVITIAEPIAGQSYNTWFFNLRYAVSDLSLDKCWYKLDSNPDIYINSCADVYDINTNSDGQHTIYLYANDTKNNIVSKSVTFSTSQAGGADTQGPEASNLIKTPGIVNPNDYVTFNATWSDNVQLAGYILSVNQGSGFINSSYTRFSGTINISSITAQITAPSGNTVYWNYFANDTSGNSATTITQIFMVSGSAGGDGGGEECGGGGCWIIPNR